jgi:hypothetical protein
MYKKEYYKYSNYEDVPHSIKEYWQTVINNNDIKSIPLSDMNSFLNGYEEYINNSDG